MVRAEIVADIEAIEPWVGSWDELAVAVGAPTSSPHWLLPWWQHGRPEGALLRIVLVHDGDVLIGVAPFHATKGGGGSTYRLLGAGAYNRVRPLAAAGRAGDVAAAIAARLGSADPPARVLRFDGLDVDEPVSSLWRAAGPGGAPPWTLVEAEIPAPYVPLDDRGFDGWMSSKSANFRQQMRRNRRRLENEGVTFRISTPDRVEADLRSFFELHHRRWNARGGSGVLSPRIEQAVAAAADELVVRGRLLLWVAEASGTALSAQLFVRAGSEISYWLGGFDDRWSQFRPALQTLVVALENAWESGAGGVDLGGGGQDYKYRLADSERMLRWFALVPRGPGYVPTRARLVPRQIREAIAGRLGPRPRSALNRLFRRR